MTFLHWKLAYIPHLMCCNGYTKNCRFATHLVAVLTLLRECCCFSSWPFTSAPLFFLMCFPLPIHWEKQRVRGRWRDGDRERDRERNEELAAFLRALTGLLCCWLCAPVAAAADCGLTQTKPKKKIEKGKWEWMRVLPLAFALENCIFGFCGNYH